MSEKNEDKIPTIYDDIGGETVLKDLVNKFYDLMHETIDFDIIRKMHPESLDSSKEKLFMFLSGWMGGPSLYISKYGHPRLRARHMPFPITEVERDQWISCMDKAMDEVNIDKKIKEPLMRSLYQTADFMRNRQSI